MNCAVDMERREMKSWNFAELKYHYSYIVLAPYIDFLCLVIDLMNVLFEIQQRRSVSLVLQFALQ